MRPRATTSGAEQRRKEQSRVRQLRYRMRKLQYEHDLEASVQRLRDEIEELERLRDRSASSASTPSRSLRTVGMSSHALATARRFVDCFAFGFSPSSGAPWLPRARTAGARPNSEANPARGQAQIAFVEEAVDTEVQWGPCRGQNAFLEHWRRFASVCDGLHVDGAAASLRVSAFESDATAGDDAACVCHVDTFVSLEVSATTLCSVLPTLQRRRPEMALRLRGQRVRLPATFVLWLNASGLVSAFDARLDWIRGLRPLVGSAEDVAEALDGANVSLAEQIGHERGLQRPPYEPGKAPARPSIACAASSSSMGTASASSSSASTSSSMSPVKMRLAYLLTSLDDAPCVTSV